ncbi:MAG: DUF4365 domain-containing protein, partial [Flavobacteriales bacterium]|nr:DUF4365 domain-containing protein [Flavobacteriales bacterium]
MADEIRDTRPQNATGMAVCDIITQGKAEHGWQPYASINDNGVDAIIIKRKNGVDTGEIMFAQVKCGKGNGYFKQTQNRPKHFGVHVGEDYIEKHRPKWNRLSGPIILIYVDHYSSKAWWTDLRDDLSYTTDNKSIILVPKHQRFGKHSFGEFKSLKGNIFVSRDLPNILTDGDDFEYLKYNKSIKESAKEFYKDWCNSPATIHKDLGEIIVSRVGWRHLTRTDRKQTRIINSLSLLGVAKKIIENVDKCYQIKELKKEIAKDNTIILTDYLAIKCNVTFPFRQSSIIQVILKRKRILNSDKGVISSKTWFFSIY